jgi:hypothetical protein
MYFYHVMGSRTIAKVDKQFTNTVDKWKNAVGDFFINLGTKPTRINLEDTYQRRNSEIRPRKTCMDNCF